MPPFERLTHKLKHAKVLLATDIDETLTHKEADVVRLNKGAVEFLGIQQTQIPYDTPLSPDEQLNVFSTGRTLEVAMNWLTELGDAIFTLHAPDALLCNNGQIAYYNTHNALSWGDFMLDLQDAPKQDAMLFQAYESALLKDYTHDGLDSERLPLSGRVREDLLRHYRVVLNDLARGLRHIVSLDVLAVEAFAQEDADKTPSYGFERLIKVMRDQAQLEVTHGFHLPVKVMIYDESSGENKPFVEHLVVAFFGQGDPKPLVQSMGSSPWQADASYLWQDALSQWTPEHSVADLEALIPYNLRSTAKNSSVDALATLVAFLKKEALHAFTAYLNTGIALRAATQTKHMESPMARQKSDSPRSYILINGLLDKGKSLSYLYDGFIDLAESLGIKGFSQQLDALITLGDGGVDRGMLSLLALNAKHHAEAVAVPNHAVLVHNGADLRTPEKNSLWRLVHHANPSVRYVDGFQPSYEKSFQKSI
jgi:hydroxymethylpyrimidine pyrophosphatase-like HAD family hydrolase